MTTELILGVAAAIALVIGPLVMVSGAPGRRLRRRIVGRPTTSIASITGGPVEIKGKIVPSEEGTFATPLSEREAVWLRLVVEELRGQGKNQSWYTLIDESHGCRFLVDDGTGTALVDPSDARVIVDAQSAGTSLQPIEAADRVVAFLERHGKRNDRWAFDKPLRFQEHVLLPDDSIYAFGRSKLKPGPTDSDGYRTVPSKRPVLRASRKRDGELVLTNKTEEQLVESLGQAWSRGVAWTVVGIVLTLIAVTLHVQSLHG